MEYPPQVPPYEPSKTQVEIRLLKGTKSGTKDRKPEGIKDLVRGKR
jgi:hypothetical protein